MSSQPQTKLPSGHYTQLARLDAVCDPSVVDDALEPRPAGEALAVLVDRHREFLAFVERRVGDRRLAEDILQDAFVRSLDKQDQIRTRDSTVAWFYRVLRNAVIDRRRRRASSERGLDAFAREVDASVHDDDVEAAICQCIFGLLPTLKPEYATAIQRIDLDGVSVKAFANELGISSNNAGVRVFRARKALRRQVERSCRSCADHGCFDCTCGQPKSP